MQKFFPTRFIHGDADQKSIPQIDPDLGRDTRPNVRLKGICPKTNLKNSEIQTTIFWRPLNNLNKNLTMQQITALLKQTKNLTKL